MTRVIGAVAKGDLSRRRHWKSAGPSWKGNFFKPAGRSTPWWTAYVLSLPKLPAWPEKWGPKANWEDRRSSARRRRHSWKDLADNVNLMASNLTSQVRNIADITTAVANRRLFQKNLRRRARRVPWIEGKGQYHGGSAKPVFTSEVTRVAREVGTEGKLGSQAIAPGAPGTAGKT